MLSLFTCSQGHTWASSRQKEEDYVSFEVSYGVGDKKEQNSNIMLLLRNSIDLPVRQIRGVTVSPTEKKLTCQTKAVIPNERVVASIEMMTLPFGSPDGLTYRVEIENISGNSKNVRLSDFKKIDSPTYKEYPGTLDAFLGIGDSDIFSLDHNCYIWFSFGVVNPVIGEIDIRRTYFFKRPALIGKNTLKFDIPSNVYSKVDAEFARDILRKHFEEYLSRDPKLDDEISSPFTESEESNTAESEVDNLDIVARLRNDFKNIEIKVTRNECGMCKLSKMTRENY